MKMLKVQMTKRVSSRVFEFAAGPGFGFGCFKNNVTCAQEERGDYWSVFHPPILGSIEVTRGSPDESRKFLLVTCRERHSAMKMRKVQMTKRFSSRIFEFASGPGVGFGCFKKNEK